MFVLNSLIISHVTEASRENFPFISITTLLTVTIPFDQADCMLYWIVNGSIEMADITRRISIFSGPLEDVIKIGGEKTFRLLQAYAKE